MNENRTSFGYREVTEHEKPGLVRDVFTRVSDRYDLMNDVMSLGIHRLWKDALVNWLAPASGQYVLDLAGGTGDIAARILARSPGTRVTVSDLTEDMIMKGRNRFETITNGNEVTWVVGDALSNPFPVGCFDRCTIGFGIRNFSNVPVALAEIYRVLGLGGRVVILEFSKVRDENLKQFYDWYSFQMIPRLGATIARDRDSYVYLVESIRKFPAPEQFMQLMRAAGYENVKHRSMSMGVATIYSGWKL